MSENPIVRHFLRRESEEQLVHERYFPAHQALLAYHIFQQALTDPDVTVQTTESYKGLRVLSDAEVTALVWRTVETGYEQDLEMVTEGMALIEHRALNGTRLVLKVGTKSYESDIVLRVILRADDQPILDAVDAWLDRLLEQEHPLKGKLLQINPERLTFLPPQGISREDIVLPSDILDELERNFGYLMGGAPRPEQLRQRSVLLAGIPGVGKTLACRWLSGQVEATVLWVTPGTVWKLGPASLFEMARMLRPTLVILEDLDLASGTRQDGAPLGELLTQMDGFANLADVGIIATTNHPEVLDHALDPRTRPGRFHRLIQVDPPGPAERYKLLLGFIDRSSVLPQAFREEIPFIVDALPGVTGARLAEIVTELEHRWVWAQHRRLPLDPTAIVRETLHGDTTPASPPGFVRGVA